MFFYVVHIALTHFLAGPFFLARYGELPSVGPRSKALPQGYEPSLPVVYAAWIGMLCIMYGLTRLWLRWRAARPVPAA
jgi:hypothetical protein